jgi:host factor-I protein
MSGEHNSVLQDTFLNQARQQKISVTIFLVNGVKLQGMITWFDTYCILLKRDHLSQLVFKHAISTVMPMAPIVIPHGGDQGGEQGGEGTEESEEGE